jgi:hypothetical protein
MSADRVEPSADRRGRVMVAWCRERLDGHPPVRGGVIEFVCRRVAAGGRDAADGVDFPID